MDSNLAQTEAADAAIAVLRERMSAGSFDLPRLPFVAAEVLASSVEEQTDVARLAELVRQDARLAAHVIHVVNSPAFRGADEILVLQQAIARLGMERIREIALGGGLREVLVCPGPYRDQADEAWEVSLAAGLWAKQAARAAGKDHEVAYLCGLLRDVGIPVLLARLGEVAPELDGDSVAVVVEQLAPLVSERVARAWSLPPPVLAAVAHRDDLAQGEGTPDNDDSAHPVPKPVSPHLDAVAAASCGAALAGWMCRRSVLFRDLVRLPAVAHLGLASQDLEVLLEQREPIRTAMECMVL